MRAAPTIRAVPGFSAHAHDFGLIVTPLVRSPVRKSMDGLTGSEFMALTL